MIKIGIFDRYLATLGGGERYSCKIAEILSQTDQYEVELLSDLHSDLDEVSKRLNLDLSSVKLKTFPFVSDDYSLNITGNYDVFINATYLSALRACGSHNIYICYFPTPFDSDFGLIHRFLLLFFKKPAKWLYKISKKYFLTPNNFEVIEGIYDLKRFILKRGSWSSGQTLIKVKGKSDGLEAGNPDKKSSARSKLIFRLGIKNPMDTGLKAMNVHITAHENTPESIPFLTMNENLGANQRKSLRIILKNETVNYIKIKSDFFIPSSMDSQKQDSRKLGVVLYDETAVSLPRKIILKILGFIPMFLVSYPSDLKFLETYDEIVSISEFSRYWIKKYWKKDSKILFPPVDTESFLPGKKEKLILSVGRFFPEHHNKKQYELVAAFIGMLKEAPEIMKGFKLVLAGGLEDRSTHIEYVNKIKELAKNYPVEIKTNISWEELKDLFSKAMIFWHASGLNEDENKNPAKFEHFGITTVEAMASGCVPVVIDKGGQKEIVQEAVNGFKFENIDEIKIKTLNVIKNYSDLEELRNRAVKDAKKYSDENFKENLLGIIKAAVLQIKKNETTVFSSSQKSHENI